MYFDDRDYDLESGISDIGKWMSEGADANAFHLELFAQDIEKILQLSPDYLFLDYPFGYRHELIKSFIEISKGDADYVIDGMGSIQDVVDEIRTYIKVGRNFLTLP